MALTPRGPKTLLLVSLCPHGSGHGRVRRHAHLIRLSRRSRHRWAWATDRSRPRPISLPAASRSPARSASAMSNVALGFSASFVFACRPHACCATRHHVAASVLGAGSGGGLCVPSIYQRWPVKIPDAPTSSSSSSQRATDAARVQETCRGVAACLHGAHVRGLPSMNTPSRRSWKACCLLRAMGRKAARCSHSALMSMVGSRGQRLAADSGSAPAHGVSLQAATWWRWRLHRVLGGRVAGRVSVDGIFWGLPRKTRSSC